MGKQISVLVAMGTRPEAIKLAPVVQRLRVDAELRCIVCATGQHRQMLDQILSVFGIEPEYDLAIMEDNQSPLDVAAAIFRRFGPIVEKEHPDWLVVQGDTASTFAAAWTAFHCRVPIAHVEAGLRTGEKYRPCPEELNRRLVGQIADLHFAPTKRAAANLMNEGVKADKIIVSGNTIVDALLKILDCHHPEASHGLVGLDGRTVLITVHRRENFGVPLEGICDAICELQERYSDVTFVVLVHYNPVVRSTLKSRLGGLSRVVLVDPLDYMTFIHLMRRAVLILSDSGGVQEEAPTVQTPVLVLRESTERPEALESGWAKLVGTDPRRIVTEAVAYLSNCSEPPKRCLAPNPFGDGRASERIVRALKEISL